MKRIAIVLFICIGAVFVSASSSPAEPTMADYTAYPPFLIVSPRPNVLILMDNSGSMFYFAYNFNGSGTSTGFDPNTRYYGYFDPDMWYVYTGTLFEESGSKGVRAKLANEWDGSFMNWLTMRRIDIVRKVVVGGKCVARSLPGDPHDLLAEKSDASSRGYMKQVDLAENYTPYSGRRCFTFTYGSAGTSEFKVGSSVGSCPCTCVDLYNVKVHLSSEPTGVIQETGTDVRMGLMFYNSEQGGRVVKEMTDDIVSSMVTAIEGDRPGTWTPLGEALWTATGYFAQSSTTGTTGPRYYSPDPQSYRVGSAADPFNYGTGGTTEYIWCSKSFVLAITDGEPTYDRNLPAAIEGYNPSYTDGTDAVPAWAGPSDPNYFWYDPNYGSHYVDDVALWSRVDVAGHRYRDLRTDLQGNQFITSYFVYAAFGSASPDGRRLLKQAARNGSFDDRNGNFLPDLQAEYDKNGDGDPDTYFEADDGEQLATSLKAAITDILRRTSSGTAVSILSTSAHGEGSLFQAYFKPKEIRYMNNDYVELNWIGFLHGLWVDDHGNLREDNGDKRLIYEEDDIVRFYLDEQNETRLKRDFVSADGPYGDGVWDETNISLEDTRSLWEAGKKLALRDLTSRPRKIFTTLDQSNLMQMLPGEALTLKNYLRAATASEAETVIRYTLGEDLSGTRSRRMFVDTNGDTLPDAEATWRLGDIVYSTPAVVSRPMENYDDIYSDPTYGEFERKYARGTAGDLVPRPTVIYVGANDGMLHAFNAGCYRSGEDSGTESREHGRYTDEYPSYFTSALGFTPESGEEIWTYVPHNLLPHLRWLADPNYTHVYYVDLKPKIVDARIFPDDGTHPGGWGTVLIGGLALGGGTYPASDFDLNGASNDPHTWSSCFFALDITNPGAPDLLWEFTDPTNLGFTTSYPAVARIGDPDAPGSWHAVFGSGPTDYAGLSSQAVSVYVLDLRTGTLMRRFQLDSAGFAGGAATVDLNLDYNTNAAYIGASYLVSGIWRGKLYRLLIGTTEGGYQTPGSWSASVLASTRSGQSITAAPAIGADHLNTPWIYWGTGRFFSAEDKLMLTTQSFYGVKDRTLADGGSAEASEPADLIDVTNVTVTYGEPNSTVSGSTEVPDGSQWEDMLEAMRGSESFPTYGWVMDLVETAGPDAGERVLEKPSVFGGLTMFTSFKPDADVCGFGGQGRLYAVYYETGTAYSEDVFSFQPPPAGTSLERSLDLEMGRPSSLAIHVGQEKGGKIYVQQSTGEIREILMKTPFHQKSGNVIWYEK
ncbi:MAG: PilC/PilY family type IV pilus protein [bacterium]